MSIDRRSFFKTTAVGSVAVAAAPARALDPPPCGDCLMESYPTITTRTEGKLRLLLVTDTHYCASPGRQDRRTTDHIRRLLDRWEPDAMVHTGDLWTETEDQDCLRYAEWAVAEMEKFGVPWAYARGNHDVCLPSDDDRCREMLATAPHGLYSPKAWEDNYRVEVKSPGAGRPFWSLYLLNNAYRRLLGFHPEQLEWFSGEAARVRELYGADLPAFAFFHIPLPEWKTIIDNGTARGVKFEKICMEAGSPGAFAALTAPGQARAMFCGHDHTNNYHGTLNGVRLEYVRSTGQGTYGGMTVLKGGTLVEVDATGAAPSFQTFTVMPDGRKFVYKRRVLKDQFEPAGG